MKSKITVLTLFFLFTFFIIQAQQAIESFTLVNADTNQDIMVLTDDVEIDGGLLEGINLNIRANTNPDVVGSVFLEISGQIESSRNENVAPYALFGDVSGNYLPERLPVGVYVLKATPYSGSSQSGTIGTELSIQFSILESIVNETPVSIIVADPRSGVAPLNVDFIGDISTDDKEIVSFLWDFKDGNTSTEANPNHIFTSPGDYFVELTVTDNEGLFHTSSIAIQVTEVFVNQPPTALLQASTTRGNTPLQISFTGSGSTDDIGVTGYLWDFGDGGTSTEADPVHTFTDPGSFDTRLTVYDAEGLEDSQTVSIAVIDANEVSVRGELKKWHAIQLDFNGPFVSETDNKNPFLDYRLNVLFTSPTGRTFKVPGFYAADGNAAETSADSGNKWAVRFSPDETGNWNYKVSFRTGNQVAISMKDTDGLSLAFDGLSGDLTIVENDKVLPDNRANGRLNYVNGHFYQYEETKNYFLKAGTDSPENLLAYSDFDNTKGSKDWQPHIQDWNSNDPVWQQNKGRGLIGAVNYLSARGMNAFSFLTMNVNGDGEDVWPWVATNHDLLDGNSPNELNNRLRYDVSKLEQWEIVFAHGDAKGMFLHFKTQETENDLLLDGGELEVQRKLYYRELIARFGHHLALNWNLGEENDLYDELGDVSNSRLIAYSNYINTIDPYNHPITVHSFPDAQDELYTPLLGGGNQLTGPSIQTLLDDTHKDVKKWVTESRNAGKPWAVANDEQGNAQTGVAADANYTGNTGSITDNRNEVRYQALWGTLLAGGYGVEYYFGYSTGETDLNAQDFRSRETKWNDAKLAIDFFKDHLPFWQMENLDELTSNDLAFCLGQKNEVYAIYLPGSETTTIDLGEGQGTYGIQWFDPINGGTLKNGTILNTIGGTEQELGNPPSNPESDWVVIVRKVQGSPTAIIDASLTEGDAPLEVVFSSEQSSDENGIIGYEWDFDDGNTSTALNPTHTFNNPGAYQVSLTIVNTEGLRDTATLIITVNDAGQGSTITVGPLVNQTNKIGDILDGSLEIMASGGDGDLVFSATGLPPGLTIGETNGKITGTIDDNADLFQPYTVTVTVDDSDSLTTDAVQADFEWTIINGFCNWNNLTAASTGRFETRTEVIDNKMYVIGGWIPSLNATGLNEIYEPDTDSWSIGTPMPTPTTHVGSVAVGTDIWFIGGFIGNHPGVATDIVQIYDTKTDSWTAGPNLPNAIGSGAATFHNNKIHFIGGLLPDRRTDTSAHLVLDLSDLSAGWTALAPLPIGLNHHWAETVNGIVYSIGGQQGHDGPITYLDVVYAYDPNNDTWNQVASLPRPRSHIESSTSVHDNKIIVAGGRDGAFFFDNIVIYDPVADAWTALCTMPNPLLAPVGIAYDNQFILSGGGESEGNLYLDETYYTDLQPGSVFDPLQLQPISNRTNDINETVDFRAMGAGGDPFAEFTFAIEGQPLGIDIDARTGQVSGSINSSADGDYQVTVRISKPGAVRVETGFTWTVNGSLDWSVKGEEENYTGRHECGFVQAGDKFYLLGGRESSRVEVFDYTTNTWSDLGDAPLNLNHFQAVEYQGLIWVIGALTDDNFPNDIPADHIWIFNPTEASWIQGPEIPQSRKRGAAGLVMYNDVFYVVGGNTNGHAGGYVPWFDAYDPATGDWTQLVDAPNARDHFYASVIDNKLYALSGRLSGGEGGVFAPTIPEVDVYDFVTQSWETLAQTSNIPTPRTGPSVAVFNEKLMVMGGSVKSENVYGTLVTNDVLKITEEFDPVSQTWKRLADTNFKRRATQAIVSGTSIYMASGSDITAGGTQKNMEFYGEDNPAGIPLVASTLSAPTSLSIMPNNVASLLLEPNNGNVGIFITSMEISGDQAADFSIDMGALTNSLLMPNSEHVVDIAYNGDGNASAILTINYGASNQLTINLESFTTGNEAPDAVANASILGGNAPLAVSFFGEESSDDDAITSYLWDFGDGNTSTEVNPIHTFFDIGIFEVSLKVTDEENLEDITTLTITVTDPNQEGITGFVLINGDTNMDMFNLFEGIQINSNDTENIPLNIRATTNPPTIGSVFLELTGPVQNTRTEGVAPYALFGDESGNYLGKLLPVGNYTISATPYSGSRLSGEKGETVSLSFSIVDEIINQPPVAIASANPLMGVAPLLVNFIGSSSTDDVGIAQYLWDFADNSITSGESNPSHLFNVPGTYDVSLTVTDSNGLQDNEVITIIVEEPQMNTAPTAIVSATPEFGQAPLEVNFIGSQSIDDMAIASYSWDFGDGSTSTMANPVHTFNDPGNYNVTLTVSDDAGLQDSEGIVIMVTEVNSNTAPTAVISATPESGMAPLEVRFTGDQSFDDTAIASYNWNFDNGGTSNMANPIHIFSEPGSYEVTLAVIDDEGLQDIENVTIQVNAPNLPPNAVITATPLEGDSPLLVAFTGSASSDDSIISTYFWDFGDGDTATLDDPVHTYNNPGSYTAILTVTDDEGLQDIEYVTIQVNAPNLNPIAIATGTPLNGDAPLEVDFTGNASSDDSMISTYFWDFKDGTTSSLVNPSHVFTVPGSYSVTLTVTDDEGLENTDTLVITVSDSNTDGVVGFTLVDSESNSDILTLTNDLEIESALISGLPLNIRANTNPLRVGSVRLQIEGRLSNVNTENVAPYALYGDLGGNYFGELFPEGNYTISATPFSGSNQSGVEGETVTVSFSVVPSVSASSVGALNNLEVSLHPNPVQEKANLSLSENQAKIAEVHVYDSQGRKIKTLDSAQLRWENGNAIMPVQGFEDGIYLIVAVTQSLEVVKTKMVIKKE